MSRSIPIAILAALALAGQAFGQAPAGPPAPAPAPAPTFTPFPELRPGSVPPPADAPLAVAEGQRFWGDAEYLLGWVSGGRLPPLVTTSPPDTPRAAAGVIGQDRTTVLYGFTPVNTQVRSGGRAALGYWLDPDRTWGAEAGFFFLESAHTSFFASSGGIPILARPFNDVVANAAASALVAFPGVSSGSVRVTNSAHIMYGGHFDLSENVVAAPWYRVDVLGGYRFLRYDERLQVEQSVQPTGGAFAAGTNVLSRDSFATRNIFNGAEVGLRGEFVYDAWSLKVLGKVAGGAASRTVDIAGNQLVTVPGADPVNRQGGLLALSSNIGPHPNHTWTAVPELGVTLGWQASENIRLRFGYTVLWWLNMVRPFDQVDLGVNPGLIPPATAAPGSALRPAFNPQGSSLLVQALNFGLEFSY
jgi:hypothetical protein